MFASDVADVEPNNDVMISATMFSDVTVIDDVMRNGEN